MTKLQNIKEDLSTWDGYHGNKNIAWRLNNNKEEFAIMCSCGEWWGWSTNLEMMKRVQKVMWEKGCSFC